MDNLLPFEQIKRNVLVRRIAETSEKYGKDPSTRTVEELLKCGIINLDKSQGPTSHQVSAYLQNVLNIKKAGHSGTLDPNVTGVLPVALNKATKVVQTLLKAGKEYVCLMHLHRKVEEYDLYKAFGKFTGRINQLPPIKSNVVRQWRKRTIYYIEVLDFMDQDVLIRVGCEAGTYIRKLMHDIGQELKCGAHMAQLRRTKAGPFNETRLFSLNDVSDAFYYYKKHHNEKFIRQVIQPVEAAVRHLPKVWMLDTSVDSICHGSTLKVPGISKVEEKIEKGDLVALYTLKDELVGFGEAKKTTKEMMGDKGVAVKTMKVVMEPGIYPTMS